jgi:serine/alanine adding enzyme
MNLRTRLIRAAEAIEWDTYVRNHPDATLYHLYGWKNVIESTYGHRTCYLVAENADSTAPRSIYGILPLVHMKHIVFGNQLISIPFFDMAGILADSPEAEQALLSEAIRMGCKLKANTIELRQAKPLLFSNPPILLKSKNQEPPQPSEGSSQQAVLGGLPLSVKSHKVRMILELPNSSEELMKSFKSKFRTKIKKALKNGLEAKIGRGKLLEDFYKVFLVNMRDLGSPVHSPKLIRSVLEEFPGEANLAIVYKEGQPIAGGMMVGFHTILENPWASALKQYARLRPNTLLYWTMLEHACNHGYRYFDFGRSTPGEGTFIFKEQWGAKPEPLHWHYICPKGNPSDAGRTDKSKFERAIQYWQKLPVPVTRIIGPMIRKHIGL